MANWTKAKLAARVLEDLGVVGEGQSPTAEQQTRTEERIDAAYARLQPKNLVPFAISAIPEWAQQGLLKIVAADVAPKYGYTGQRLMEKKAEAREGKIELANGAAGYAPPIPVEAFYF